jgi:hypothetical protein
MSKKPSKLIRKKQAVSQFFNLERMFSNDFTIQELEGLLEDLATLDGRKSVLDVLFNDSKDHSALETYSTGFDVIQEIGCDTMTGDFSFEPFLREIHRDLSQQYRKCTHCNLRPQSWNWVQSKNVRIISFRGRTELTALVQASLLYFLFGSYAEQGRPSNLTCLYCSTSSNLFAVLSSGLQ